MLALEDNSNVLALRMLFWIFVVFDITRFGRIDGMISSHGTIVSGKPVGTTLAKNNVTRDYILFCN